MRMRCKAEPRNLMVQDVLQVAMMSSLAGNLPVSSHLH